MLINTDVCEPSKIIRSLRRYNPATDIELQQSTQVPVHQPVISTSDQPKPAPRYVKTIFLILNVAFMVFLCAAGVEGMKSAALIYDASTGVVGFYLLLFAVMLIIFEIIQIYPCASVDTIYKKNFGFLYGMVGKCLFIIFMAIFCFGLVTNTSASGTDADIISTNTMAQRIALAAGILVGIWGIVQLAVYLKVRLLKILISTLSFRSFILYYNRLYILIIEHVISIFSFKTVPKFI